MKAPQSMLAKLTLLAAILCWTPQASAYSTYYTNGTGSNLACSLCHSSTVTTCNGCHSHGTHPDQTRSAINVIASTDKTTYQPGETVTVTVNGGYRNGWVRANLYDGNMAPLASSCPTGKDGCYSNTFPSTVTAAAPTTPGTYVWRASWYGNAYDASGARFSPACASPVVPPCFREDPNNNSTGAVHGEEIVAVTQFTVAAAPSGISVAPTSLSFGDVAVGTTASRTFTISNGGTAALTGTVALAAGTSGEFNAAPATFSIPAGGPAVTVTATYAPSAVGADSGALVVASDDPASPTVTVGVSGSGVQPPSSGSAGPSGSSGGCSGSGGSAGWLALAALGLLAAGRRARHRHTQG